MTSLYVVTETPIAQPMKVIGNGCFGKVRRTFGRTIAVVRLGSPATDGWNQVMMVKCKKNGKIYAMKTIKKAHVVKNNKVRHTLAERNIMQKINHPFVMKLHYAFQNNGKLYMVMDYLNGGDIFYHLSVSRRFPEERSKFYAAEVLMALECLHEHGFIYRDLKPENVLVQPQSSTSSPADLNRQTDSEGHIRLTDFGLSKENFEEGMSMNTFVGTTV
eukprot:749056-Hanusia_phi.AAC.2